MTTLIRSFVTIAAVVFFAAPALAGPPLICHPFETSSGKLIAWGAGPGWNTPDRSYDVRKLVADTGAVLTEDAPILTRMENMRRATIYAMRDPVVAHELLKTVMARALATSNNGTAWFDAGYLIESYKQAAHLREDRKPELRAWAAVDETIRVDGYNWVKKAMAMSAPSTHRSLGEGGSAEMEFAASLMTQGSIASAHRAKAIAAAPKGSTLAKNLASSAFLF
ncbi:MAG TPA: hypothetical protein VFZ31_15915 [Vicinamibacterales bacterium]